MNFWYSLITRWTRWTFFLQSSAHLKLKANFVQPFLRPPPCQKTSICQNMKKLGEREILFPVSSRHQVLIKNSKTALLQKKLDIKHAETNIADVTREVGLKQSWHIVSVINSTISLFPPPSQLQNQIIQFYGHTSQQPWSRISKMTILKITTCGSKYWYFPET